jgi:hypothetical protein
LGLDLGLGLGQWLGQLVNRPVLTLSSLVFRKYPWQFDFSSFVDRVFFFSPLSSPCFLFFYFLLSLFTSALFIFYSFSNSSF